MSNKIVIVCETKFGIGDTLYTIDDLDPNKRILKFKIEEIVLHIGKKKVEVWYDLVYKDCGDCVCEDEIDTENGEYFSLRSAAERYRKKLLKEMSD